MLQDFDDYQADESVFDFCIVGAGPAGMTLAIRLADNKQRVLLLEGGGLEYTEQSQEIYDCISTGHQAWPRQMRLRYLGGTSNHWAGRCRPFEYSDFEQRMYGDLPGWPIRASEIAPYLEQAKAILDVDSDFRSPNESLLGGKFAADIFASSPPTRFRTKYSDKLENIRNLLCLYNANAIELKLDKAGSRVTQIVSRGFDGRTRNFKAGYFILCMGAIENARFLLNSNSQIPEGVGNQTDMVGRCFMEHFNVPVGEFVYSNTDRTEKMQFINTDATRREAGVGRGNFTFSIVDNVKSYGRTREIKSFLKNLACKMNIAEQVQFISDFQCPGTGRISTMIEQTPNKESRIRLSSENDALGMKKAIVNWVTSETDRRTVRYLSKEIAKAFSESDLGVVRLNDFILDESLDIRFSQHAHHMGTTRMASNHRDGVVDENLKVHETENLYVAGSSIFATGGASNPTLPIIQFCLRLSDHLLK